MRIQSLCIHWRYKLQLFLQLFTYYTISHQCAVDARKDDRCFQWNRSYDVNAIMQLRARARILYKVAIHIIKAYGDMRTSALSCQRSIITQAEWQLGDETFFLSMLLLCIVDYIELWKAPNRWIIKDKKKTTDHLAQWRERYKGLYCPIKKVKLDSFILKFNYKKKKSSLNRSCQMWEKWV